jgi:penicillin-binding protein A
VPLTDAQWALALWGVVCIGAIVAAMVLRRRARDRSPIRRNIPTLALAVGAGLIAIAIQAARFQVYQQRTIAQRTGFDPESGDVLADARSSVGDVTRARGSILTADGVALAWSEAEGEVMQRRYAEAEIAHPAGYFSPVLYGKDGIEEVANEALTRGTRRTIQDQILGALELRGNDPEDVILTIRSDLQRLAQTQIADHIGAAVVVDAQTGAVLALASNPFIDPAPLAKVTDDGAQQAKSYWTDLLDSPSRPFVRRSTLGIYTPGSTFKVVTAAAAIDAGIATPETDYEDDGVLSVDGHVVVDPNRPDDSVTSWTLTDGIAFSLNVVLAQVGIDLGADALQEYANRFGFNGPIPFDLPTARSQVASSGAFLESTAALADTAFGQGELLATPLHMAVVAAAIANDGRMMRPYLIAGYRSHRTGERLEETEPRVLGSPISTDTAQQVATMMVTGVESGYSGGAYVPGITIGGKTGTAETGDGPPHAWFIGFGGPPGSRLAVAVVLEHGGSGGGLPSVIAGSLLRQGLA